MAPHRYPFQLVEPPRAAGGAEPVAGGVRQVAVRLSANASLLRGPGPLSLFLLLEIAAQSVLHLAGSEAVSAAAPPDDGGQVMLAGVEEMTLAEGAEENPPGPGDLLLVRAEELARFARLIKMRVDIDRDGMPLATAVLLLAF